MDLTDHGYHEDSEDHFKYPHVHRCVDCGGYLIYASIDNANCVWCNGDGRAHCSDCQKGA